MKKENEAIKDRIIKDMRNLFEQEKEDYYKPIRVCNFWSRNYDEYESNGDRNKTLSTEEYINKVRSYLKHIINGLKKSDTWKTQLTVATDLISSKESGAKCVIHSF